MATITASDTGHISPEARERIGKRNLLSRALNDLERAQDQLAEAHECLGNVLELVTGFGVGQDKRLVFQGAVDHSTALINAVGRMARIVANMRDEHDLAL